MRSWAPKVRHGEPRLIMNMVLSGPLMFGCFSYNFKNILWKWWGKKRKWHGKKMETTWKKNHLIFKEGLFFFWLRDERNLLAGPSRAEVSCPWNMVTSFGSLIRQQHRTELGRNIWKVGASGRKGGSQAEGLWPLTAKEMTSDHHHVSTLTRLSMKCIFLTRLTYKCPLCAPEVSLQFRRGMNGQNEG